MLRHALIATAVLAAAIAPAGCGSDDEPETSTAQGTTTAAAAASAAPSDERRAFEDEIRAALDRSGQSELVDVDCVIRRLRETLPNALVATATEAVERGEEIPQKAVDAAFDAGKDCASR